MVGAVCCCRVTPAKEIGRRVLQTVLEACFLLRKNLPPSRVQTAGLAAISLSVFLSALTLRCRWRVNTLGVISVAGRWVARAACSLSSPFDCSAFVTILRERRFEPDIVAVLCLRTHSVTPGLGTFALMRVQQGCVAHENDKRGPHSKVVVCSRPMLSVIHMSLATIPRSPMNCVVLQLDSSRARFSPTFASDASLKECCVNREGLASPGPSYGHLISLSCSPLRSPTKYCAGYAAWAVKDLFIRTSSRICGLELLRVVTVHPADSLQKTRCFASHPKTALDLSPLARSREP